MKKSDCLLIAAFIAVLVMVFSAAKGASAKDEPAPSPAPSDTREIWMCVNILCINEEGYRTIGDSNTISSGSLRTLIESKKGRSLETLRFLVQNNQETITSIGHKFPITYFDPKASQYQIVFVDVGMRFIIRPVITPENRLNIDIKASLSTIEDYRQEIERDTAFYFPSVKTIDTNLSIPGMKNGETVIISNLQGLSLEDVLKDMGEKAAYYEKGSRMIIAVTPFISPVRAAAAETKSSDNQLVIEMKSLRLSKAAALKYLDNYRMSEEKVAALIKSGGAKVINSQKILSSGKESLLLVGRKYPLTYFDPRSGFYQVIYIDIGLKGVITCKPAGPGKWNVLVRHDFSNADPSTLFGVKRDQIPLKTYTIRSETSLEMNRGESVVVLSLSGDYYFKALKDILLPGIELSPDDELIFMVTVR